MGIHSKKKSHDADSGEGQENMTARWIPPKIESEQALCPTDTFVATLREVVELARLARTCCDKPEDRMWRAADNTWWRRDGPRWIAAGPPNRDESAGSATCSECNWTNVFLLNLGEPGKPRWVCQGCCKRAVETRHAAPERQSHYDRCEQLDGGCP